MHGWRCRLIQDSTIAPSDETTTTAPVLHSEIVFTLVPGKQAGVLGLHLESAEQSLGDGARIVALDRERIVVGRRDETQSQSATDHPDVARVIEAATGAARLWVNVDSRGRWVRQAGTIDPVVREMFTGIDALGRTWLFAYPELPDQLLAGRRWQGLRALPVAGEQADVRLDFHVREVAADHTTIELHYDAEMDLPAGLRGRLRVEGTSKIRRGDAAFLGATYTTSGSFVGPKGSLDVRM